MSEMPLHLGLVACRWGGCPNRPESAPPKGASQTGGVEGWGVQTAQQTSYQEVRRLWGRQQEW